LSPGNAAVALWWDFETKADTGVKEVVLFMKGYKTTFEDGRP
jgi:hypothetical protein